MSFLCSDLIFVRDSTRGAWRQRDHVVMPALVLCTTLSVLGLVSNSKLLAVHTAVLYVLLSPPVLSTGRLLLPAPLNNYQVRGFIYVILTRACRCAQYAWLENENTFS